MKSIRPKKNNSNKMISVGIGVIIIAFLTVIPLWFMSESMPDYMRSEYKHELISLILGNMGLFINITFLIRTTYFNNIEEFNRDSLHICLCCISPLIPLFFYLIFGACIKEVHKYLKNYSIFSAVIIIFLSLYFWIIYLFRCRQAITNVNEDRDFFTVKMVRSMLSAILVCFSATLIIESLPSEQNVIKSVYEVVNIFVNAMYPPIDMYTYVRSKLDKYMENSNTPIQIKSHSN